MTEHYDKLETRPPEQRETDLTQAIRAQLVHARANSPAYAEVLGAFDCEGFADLAALGGIPLTRKSGLMERQASMPPFGGYLAVPRAEIGYIHVSPGPIYEACTHRPDFWRLARAMFAAGFRNGDLVHNSFSYHLTPAGMMLDSGARALGCGVIPGGVGQTEMQVQTIHDLRPNAYVGTPSFLKIMLEKADEMALDISSITHGLVSGEALPPPLREYFNDRGIAVMQVYATADVGAIAYETTPNDGLIIDEGIYVEIVRPGSDEPVADGEVGEVVVTSLNPDYPLIRFATGDLSTILAGQSPCGRTNRRLKGWLGRADQTTKVRGMFIHPQQIHQITKRHPQLVRARLVVEWIDQQDCMTLQCETAEGSDELAVAIANSIRDLCKVRGEVKLVAPGTIANDGIIIEDCRTYE